MVIKRMGEPCIGIFWGFHDSLGNLRLLVEKTPIPLGESYGDCITHPGGHYDFWEGLSKLGVGGLERKGLPIEPALYEYEDFPRGRVVFWPKENHFIIYADRRLQTKEFVEKITEEFNIPSGSFALRSDSHYQ